MARQSDVLVLGAGIVGVCVALHLQARGRSVVLLDRGPAGGETSYGNAGLVERASVIPYAMPRGLPALLGYASNRTAAVRYQPAYLASILPWLARYWFNSGAKRLRAIGLEILPLIERSVAEHLALMEPAGAAHLMRNDGWIEFFPDARHLEAAKATAAGLGEFSLNFDVLDAAALKQREPAVLGAIAGAIHWRDPITSCDPGAVTRAYAELFVARGGRTARGDAQALSRDGAMWQAGGESAREAVVALGPWSGDLARRFGYRFPVAFKRGYHMHYALEGNVPLAHPICDPAAGYVLSPMARGIRLSTGIELAPRDAPSDTAQLAMAERLAREILPLGKALDPVPWRGARPCLPDMKPVIGAAPLHKGLWFAFGHAHHGFTLGPATGRLLAELVTGEKPFADARPFAPGRF